VFHGGIQRCYWCWVGYREGRYYSGAVLLPFAVLFALLMSLTPRAWTPRRFILLLLVTALPLIPMIVRPPFSNLKHLFSPSAAMIPLSPTPEMQRVTDAVHRDAGGALSPDFHQRLYCHGQIWSLKGEATIVMPRLKDGTFAAFARDLHVTHV
jgi:hypothetical protein